MNKFLVVLCAITFGVLLSFNFKLNRMEKTLASYGETLNNYAEVQNQHIVPQLNKAAEQVDKVAEKAEQNDKWPAGPLPARGELETI